MLCQEVKIIASQRIIHIKARNSYLVPQYSYFVAQDSYLVPQDNKNILDAYFYLQVWAINVPLLKGLSSLVDSPILKDYFKKVK